VLRKQRESASRSDRFFSTKHRKSVTGS
jgi:hypothetical protein